MGVDVMDAVLVAVAVCDAVAPWDSVAVSEPVGCRRQVDVEEGRENVGRAIQQTDTCTRDLWHQCQLTHRH
jgi:hypothetical protein